MSNDSDLFFAACRVGSLNDIKTLLAGRCVTEKRQGALMCYEHGCWDVADAVMDELPGNQRAACMEEILAKPQRFNHATQLCNHLYNSSKKQLSMRSMAVNNHWRSFEFLIKNNHLPDPRKIPSNPAQLSEDAYVAARCGSLEVLDLLTPNRTPACVRSLLGSTLDVGQFSTIPHLCDTLPEELFSVAMQKSLQYHSMDLVKFLIHSMQNRANTTLLLSAALNNCLRNGWDEPVHDYASQYPHTLKDILAQMEKLGDDKVAQFLPFLSYYEKHLINQNISENQPATRTTRKL